MAQFGELTVSSSDQILILLSGTPAKVEARFIDHLLFVPCSPQHCDTLSFQVDGLFLVISWSVSGVREVVYKIYY